MRDKNGVELAIGDMVRVRIFYMGAGAKVERGFIESFRGHEHCEIKIRNGRKEHYMFLGNVLELIPREEAILYLLEDTKVGNNDGEN